MKNILFILLILLVIGSFFIAGYSLVNYKDLLITLYCTGIGIVSLFFAWIVLIFKSNI